VSAACGRVVSKPASRIETRGHQRNRWHSEFGEVSKGQRKLYVQADNGTEKEYSVPRGVHINVQEGERVKAGRTADGRPASTRTTFWPCSEKRNCSLTWWNEIQEVYRFAGRQHLGQAH